MNPQELNLNQILMINFIIISIILMQKQSKSSSIKVFIRVRPLVSIQNGTNQVVQVQSDNKSIKVAADQYNQYQVKFDHAFDSESTQGDVYKQLQGTMPKVMEGFNITIFAYGQTGSGKTHTMFGQGYQSRQKYDISQIQDDDGQAGIIPRSIYQIFKLMDDYESCKIFCSFLQIYNEKIFDLLNNTEMSKPLNIHESKTQGIFVEGLTQFGVQKFQDCMDLLKQGVKNRTVRQTSMNARSSRSHTIFQLLVEIEDNGKSMKGRLNLCDLAGSQKINKKQAMGGQQLKQLKNINLSLTTLGKVICSLSAGQNKISAFRQSKLTRLLQKSLTENTYTYIFGNLSPSMKNMDETLSTLKFVERANHITLKIKPTQSNSSQNPETVGKLKKQIEHLKDLLQMKNNGAQNEQIALKLSKIYKSNQKMKNKDISKEQFNKLMEENKRMKQEIQLLQVKIQETQQSLSTQYKQKLNKAKRNYYLPSRGPSQSSNNSNNSRLSSSLVQAGKNIATIDHDAYGVPKSRDKEKANIAKRLQQMQDKKRYNEYKLIDELDGYVQKNNKMKYLNSSQQKQGKVSGKRQQSYAAKKSIAKVDYGDKIKELQARLFRK